MISPDTEAPSASHDRLRAIGAAIWQERPTPSATPFTVGYVLLLAGTTLVLGIVDHDVHHKILAESSTDVAHLNSAPVRVIVASALWLPDMHWVFYAVLFSLVLAPVADVTTIGHVMSVGVGLAWWPWLHRRGLLGRRATEPFRRRRQPAGRP